MTDLALPGGGTRAAWREEARATLALSWPLILTNLAQSAPTTIDVVMLGWLGSTALAAGALGTNLYFAFLIFGIGLMTAVSPMVAREIGAKKHSVRDVRRTVRQGLWSAVAITLPVWTVLWFAEPILLALGQEPGLAQRAAPSEVSGSWPSASRIGSANHRMHQTGIVIAMALHRPCRTVRRTSRTE